MALLHALNVYAFQYVVDLVSQQYNSRTTKTTEFSYKDQYHVISNERKARAIANRVELLANTAI